MIIISHTLPQIILHDQAGSLSSGLSHKTKFVTWQCVAQAVNEVGGGQQRSLKDVKKMV